MSVTEINDFVMKTSDKILVSAAFLLISYFKYESKQLNVCVDLELKYPGYMINMQVIFVLTPYHSMNIFDTEEIIIARKF